MSAAEKISYNSYSTETKLKLIQHGNPNHFIEQGIPRTTALYWIKNSQKIKNIEPQTENLTDKKTSQIEVELIQEKALKELLIKVRKLHPYSFSKKKVTSKTVKKDFVLSIYRVKDQGLSLQKILHTIALSPSTFYRWQTLLHPCELSGKKCQKRSKHQLTEEELQNMKRYLTSKKYAHIPISSLCPLAQREGKLFCSVQTWYKYKNLFDWRRPVPHKHKKKPPEGYKTEKPNEAWHIDVSEIKVSETKKYYFQAVLDNFSRCILAWLISDEISAKNTLGLIKEAKNFCLEKLSSNGNKVITDGGSENTAHIVTKYIYGENLTHLVARRDIVFSNSMIEVFFRSLKHHFLFNQKIKSKEHLVKKVSFYVKQHNEVIPKPFLNNATPLESYTGTWTEESTNELSVQKLNALKNRKNKPLKPICNVCKGN